MVRRQRDSTTEEDDIIPDSPPAKKHKRHRNRKHKRRRYEDDFESDSSVDVSLEDAERPDPAYQPKLKIAHDQPTTSAAQLLKLLKATAQVVTQSQSMRGGGKERSLPGPPVWTSPKCGRRRRVRGKDSGTSSEEERWLDAIKSGKLEEVDDELKKIKPKDPKMMTARQRAMYERSTEKETGPAGPGGPAAPRGALLLALPSGYKEKVMTAEAIQKAAIKSQKRKQLADEKREKDKKKTMDRLLKKQESKNAKSGQKGKAIKKQVPMIIYKNNNNEISLSLPIGIPFPLERSGPIEPPKPVRCGVGGCPNLKKYSCSKTNVPLCSLDCYKINLQTIVV